MKNKTPLPAGYVNPFIQKKDQGLNYGRPKGEGRKVRSSAELAEYLRRIVAYAKGDNLERAMAAFRGLTAEQMQEQHGRSGATRQEILDDYRVAREQHEQAAAYLETLLTADKRTSGQNPAAQPEFKDELDITNEDLNP